MFIYTCYILYKWTMLHGYCRLDCPRAKKNYFSTAAEVGLVGATPQRGGGLDALWRHVRLLKKKIMDLIGLIINKIKALYLYIYTGWWFGT